MDAVEFLNIIDQISKKGTPEEKMIYNASREAGKNYMAVAYAERWSKEHPRKTRQSEFLKQWPEARIDKETGVLTICPAQLKKEYTDDRGACNTYSIGTGVCNNCSRKFWLEEVE